MGKRGKGKRRERKRGGGEDGEKGKEEGQLRNQEDIRTDTGLVFLIV